MANTISNIEIIFQNSKNPPHTSTDSVSEGINDIISIFEVLLNFGCTLCAFQFIGIIFDKSVLESGTIATEVSYFFLALGFIFSLFTVFLCYVIIYFFKTLRYENMEFIETAIRKYKVIFYFSYTTIFVNSAFFMIPINIFVHEYLKIYFAVTINVISFLLFVAGITIYIIVIQRKQRFVIDNDHTIQRTVFHND